VGCIFQPWSFFNRSSGFCVKNFHIKIDKICIPFLAKNVMA
jgi:hypothetical protein